MMKLLFALLAVGGLMIAPAVAAPAGAPTIVLDTTKGVVKIRLRPDLAPKHVERIKQLVSEKFYDGVPFHRVIDGFMAQTGDPTGTGTGGSKYPNVADEHSRESFKRGTVGMARTDEPDTANSQFFICFAASTWLDGKYTVIGEVTAGMDVVDRLKKGAPRSGVVSEPDTVKTIRLEGAPN